MQEITRKIFHAASGTTIALLYYYGLINKTHLTALTAIAFLFYIAYKRHKIPIIHQLVKLMERKKDISKAGLTSLFFIIGSTAAILLYSKEAAVASILILAWGDSISCLAGKKGRIPYFNPKKKWEGIIAGAITAAIAAQFFVKLIPAIISSAITMLIEGLDIKIFGWKIDDNLLIPIIAGLLLTILG